MRILLFLLLFITHCAFGGTVVYQHLGSADPVTEGWQRHQFGPSFSEGSVLESGTFGFDAWKIDDDHAGFGGDATELRYRVNLADEHVTAALAAGWDLIARVRIADDPNFGFVAAQSSIGLTVSIGSKIYALDFATYTGTSVTIVTNANEGPQFNVGGNGYHEYRISYSPQSDTVSLRADGQLLTSDLPGLAISNGNYIHWGSIASQDVGQGNWNELSFSVPEPSSAVYLVSAILVLCLRQRGQPCAADGLNPADMSTPRCTATPAAVRGN